MVYFWNFALMKHYCRLISTTIFLILLPEVGSQWWFLTRLPIQAVGFKTSPRSISTWCSSTDGLVSKQRTLCHQSPELILSLVESGQLSLRECQHHFRTERWNCSSLSNDNTGINNFMKQGTRESAFVYALSSATFVHSITRACSAGKIQQCSCDPKRRYGVGHDNKGQFQWGGCSDHVKFGSRFSRRFLDAPYQLLRRNHAAHVSLTTATKSPPSLTSSESVRALINLHNNRAGRHAVAQHNHLICKCHGISGACTMRTCWRAMHNMRVISTFLRNKFDAAIRVKSTADSRSLQPANRKQGYQTYLNSRKNRDDSQSKKSVPPRQRQSSLLSKSILIYLHESPNYCLLNTTLGSTGTNGRECNRTSTGSDSCAILCCGRGYDTFSVVTTVKCECKFFWCCKVNCKLCTREVEKHRCKP